MSEIIKSIAGIFADEKTACGEAPLWDAKRQRLLWVDNERALVFARGCNDSATTVLHRDYPAFALALNDDGRLVMAGPRGVALRSNDGAVSVVLENSEGGDCFFNDAVASPVGGLYAGSFHWDEKGIQRTGRLYHVSASGEAQIMDEGFQLSNGLAVSPDNRTLYFADTIARTIYAYEIAVDGRLANRRVFARVSREDGLPDGLTVDAAGFVWCALWYGGQVIRFDHAGRIERRITLPAKQVSSLTFGGPEMTELFVTTAANHWPSDYQPAELNPQDPMGGAVYRLRLDVAGKPEHHCRFMQ
ncbi:MAG: SMP-30/gluconolactonase/LRE family protein [Verrucomicrobiota bacterium]